MPHRCIIAICLLTLLGQSIHAQPTTQPDNVVRCAVINGMMDVDFWPQVAARFEKQTGIKVETVSYGEKTIITEAFRKGGIDLITLHASDQIINLVGDGLALDPQPWCRNDLVLIGPPSDPAKIAGMTNAGDALRKIQASRAPLVVHASLGAQEVLRGILDREEIELDPAGITMLFEDRQRLVLGIAAEKNAYTMIGRIPYLTGKLPDNGMKLMVQGDPHLCRPFMVAVVNPDKVPGARLAIARQLARFLRAPETQAWIAQFGKGQYDDRPLFFPVELPESTAKPGVLLDVVGEIQNPQHLTSQAFASFPRQKLVVKDRTGAEQTMRGFSFEICCLPPGFHWGSSVLRAGSLRSASSFTRPMATPSRSGFQNSTRISTTAPFCWPTDAAASRSMQNKAHCES